MFFLFIQWWQKRHTRFTRYPEFGISIPAGYEIHGIDVSRYQRNIDWTEVRDMEVNEIKLGFVFMKATEGINDADPYFKRNWRQARKAGMTRGAYHFFLATKDGKTQARNFIDQVELVTGDMPPVLDVEQTYGVPLEKLRIEVKKWLEVTEKYYGVKPIIYTSVDFYERNLKGIFDDYPLWIAHYLQKQKPRIKRDWSFWQYSEKGRVNGITSSVDFNAFNGDSLAFRSMLVP